MLCTIIFHGFYFIQYYYVELYLTVLIGVIDKDGHCCHSGMKSDDHLCCPIGSVRDLKGKCCKNVIGPCLLCDSDVESFQYGLYSPCCPEAWDT